MQIDEEQVGDVTIIALGGELDARTLPDANEKLDQLIAALRTRIVFNLSGIDMVTSTAVGFLIAAAKRTRRLGGDVVLSQPTRLFRKTIDALRTGDFFKLCDSDADAVAYFRNAEVGEDTAVAEPPPEKRGLKFWRKSDAGDAPDAP